MLIELFIEELLFQTNCSLFELDANVLFIFFKANT